MLSKIRGYLDEINSKLFSIIIFYVAILVLWAVMYALVGYRFYEAPAQGLIPDMFKIIGGNLVFFGIFGIATLIPTFTRPRDEPIDRRLSFLITSNSVSETALQFIRQEVVRLCGFIEKSSVDLIIREYDPQTKAVKLEYRAKSIARNTFESENYIDDNFIIIVHPDSISKNGVFGEITFAEFGYGNDTEEIFKTPLVLSSDNKFQFKTSLKIAKNSATIYRLHNWIWYESIEPYYVNASRYTEMLTITLKNETNYLIKIQNTANGGEQFDLKAQESKEIFRAAAAPGTMNVFRILEVKDTPFDETSELS